MAAPAAAQAVQPPQATGNILQPQATDNALPPQAQAAAEDWKATLRSLREAVHPIAQPLSSLRDAKGKSILKKKLRCR